ncbi:hypothetical protein PT2222_340033 [Paraburkholderia tropica]
MRISTPFGHIPTHSDAFRRADRRPMHYAVERMNHARVVLSQSGRAHWCIVPGSLAQTACPRSWRDRQTAAPAATRYSSAVK